MENYYDAFNARISLPLIKQKNMKMTLHGYLFYLLDTNQTFCSTLIIHCTLFFLELVQESLEQDFCLHLPSLVSLESIINMDIHI